MSNFELIAPPHRTLIEREIWLDYAKSIGIFLVVLGHLPFCGNYVISLFHMPLFFILSGYLYKHRPFCEEFVRSTRALLLPYLIYNSILTILYALFFDISIVQLVTNIFLSLQEDLPFAFRAMWFLISLYTMRILSAIFRQWSIILSVIFFTIVCVSKSFQTIDTITPDVFQITSSAICYPFFIIGMLLRKYNLYHYIHFYTSKMSLMKQNVLLVFLFIIVSIGMLMLNEHEVNIFRTYYGNNALLFLISSTILSLLFILFCIENLKKRYLFVEQISKGTLFIMCSHQLIIVSVISFIPHISIFSLLFALLIVSCSIYPINFFSRHIPIMLGR